MAKAIDKDYLLTQFRNFDSTVLENKYTELEDIAPEFSTSTNYAVGDYVNYEGSIYKCTTAHSAGAWVAGDFTAVVIGNEVKNKMATDGSNANSHVNLGGASTSIIFTTGTRQVNGPIGVGSVAEGDHVLASGDYSHAEGYRTAASANYAHAEGTSTVSNYVSSHAEGQRTCACGQASHAEGYGTTASQVIASGKGAHAEGAGTTASGNNSHAEGQYSSASGIASHAAGAGTTASNTGAHSEGGLTYASGNYSHAEGCETSAYGNYAHTEGAYTYADGESSHAEGSGTSAIGDASHAEGNYTCANNNYAHAEGNYTTAEGLWSHAEGRSTYAKGDNSHAEGYKATAYGSMSHAEGQETYAIGGLTHAEGRGTYAGYTCQHVGGKYNNNKSTTLFEIGNGTADNARSNAFEIYSDGKISQDNGTTKFKFTSNNGVKGYYDENDTFNAFGSGGSSDITDLAPAFSTSTAYAIGDYVTYNDNLYRCITAHAAGDWVVSDFTQVTVGDELKTKMATDGSNAANHVNFHSAFTIGDRRNSTTGTYSFVLGHSCIASDDYSHAEGYQTNASGKYSYAEGYKTVVSGDYAHASGCDTRAGQLYQYACGIFNNNKSTTLFEVGNGQTANQRSNAFEVYSDGKISQDDGTTKFKFTSYNNQDGYYDSSDTFHAFGSGGGSTVSIAQSGTASASTTRTQQLTIDNVATDIVGTKYMETTITLSTSASVTATFTNAAITNTSNIEVFAGRTGGDDTTGGQNVFPYENVTVSVSGGVGTCEVKFPKFESAISLTVGIYIK